MMKHEAHLVTNLNRRKSQLSVICNATLPYHVGRLSTLPSLAEIALNQVAFSRRGGNLKYGSN